MKTCPKCKVRNLNSAKNCENCHTPLESTKSEVSLQNEDKSEELKAQIATLTSELNELRVQNKESSAEIQ